MKKKASRLPSSVPAKLLAELKKQKALVAQQEGNGNYNTYDHTKLARLETAVASYQNEDDEVKHGS